MTFCGRKRLKIVLIKYKNNIFIDEKVKIIDINGWDVALLDNITN